jgi:hypothetical protein
MPQEEKEFGERPGVEKCGTAGIICDKNRAMMRAFTCKKCARQILLIVIFHSILNLTLRLA